MLFKMFFTVSEFRINNQQKKIQNKTFETIKPKPRSNGDSYSLRFSY